MTETTTMTIRVPVAIKKKFDRLAEVSQRSRSYLAAEALEIYVDQELAICEGILRGIEDVRAGRVVPHEQVVAETQAIIDAAYARERAAHKRAGRR